MARGLGALSSRGPLPHPLIVPDSPSLGPSPNLTPDCPPRGNLSHLSAQFPAPEARPGLAWLLLPVLTLLPSCTVRRLHEHQKHRGSRATALSQGPAPASAGARVLVCLSTEKPGWRAAGKTGSWRSWELGLQLDEPRLHQGLSLCVLWQRKCPANQALESKWASSSAPGGRFRGQDAQTHPEDAGSFWGLRVFFEGVGRGWEEAWCAAFAVQRSPTVDSAPSRARLSARSVPTPSSPGPMKC